MDKTISNSLFPEKRTKPRINCDYPATVWGLDEHGQKFIDEARVTNLSSSGALAVSKRSIPNGAEVYVKIAISSGSLEWGTSNLATRGNVVRNEPQSDGAIGIAIKFQKYKFL